MGKYHFFETRLECEIEPITASQAKVLAGYGYDAAGIKKMNKQQAAFIIEGRSVEKRNNRENAHKSSVLNLAKLPTRFYSSAKRVGK